MSDRNGDRRAARERAGLLPPPGDWCGCCGRQAETGELWCRPCRAHLGPAMQPHERTYYAQHGIECPFTGEPIT